MPFSERFDIPLLQTMLYRLILLIISLTRAFILDSNCIHNRFHLSLLNWFHLKSSKNIDSRKYNNKKEKKKYVIG